MKGKEKMSIVERNKAVIHRWNDEIYLPDKLNAEDEIISNFFF